MKKQIILIALIGSLSLFTTDAAAMHDHGGGHRLNSRDPQDWQPWLIAKAGGIAAGAIQYTLSHFLGDWLYSNLKSGNRGHGHKTTKGGKHGHGEQAISPDLQECAYWNSNVKNSKRQIDQLGEQCNLGNKECCQLREELKSAHIRLIQQSHRARMRALEKAGIATSAT